MQVTICNVKQPLKISESYLRVYQCWQAESAHAQPTTHEMYLNTIKSFAQFLDCKPIHDISRKDISEFSTYLIKNGNSPVTSKQKIGIIKTLFNAAINREIVQRNPVENFRSPYRQPKKPRVGFSVEDLQRIFSSPIYTAGYLPIGGGKVASYWLPLLALFTGARVEELAQLHVSDIQIAPGLGHYLNISDLGGTGARLKNEHSRRRIPIHAVLIACGFINHAKTISNGFLFPDLKPNPRGKRGGYFSYFFSNYLRKKIGIKDPRKVFHSFRHTFKDICRRTCIEEAVHDALTGHKSASISRGYGNDQFPLEPLFKAMEQFEINGLNLEHLYDQPISEVIKIQDIKIISAFYGLAVGFPIKNASKINRPILIAVDQEQTIGVDLSTIEIAFGELSPTKIVLLRAWIQIHQEELLLNWQTGRNRLDYFPIDPLR